MKDQDLIIVLATNYKLGFRSAGDSIVGGSRKEVGQGLDERRAQAQQDKHQDAAVILGCRAYGSNVRSNE